MNLHEPLPDPAELDLPAAKALRQRILTETRPAILRRLTELGAVPNPDLDAQIDRCELEMHLNAIDSHDWALDERITAADLPTPAQLMPPELEDLVVTGRSSATARATLFYSPEAKFNVHGPIMLYHAAALAEHLLADGEALAWLETTSFSKMVISQLRLTMFDPEAEATAAHKPAMASASITGAFGLTSGRRLSFYGIQDHARPVARRSWINRVALNLVPRDREPERDGKLYRVRTPTAPTHAPATGLGVPAQLMTVVDTLVMLMLTQPMHADETRLLLSVRHLPMGTDMLDMLVIGTELCFTPHRDKARRVGATLVMMPTDIGFARHPDVRTRIMTGESSEPYYRMPVG